MCFSRIICNVFSRIICNVLGTAAIVFSCQSDEYEKESCKGFENATCYGENLDEAFRKDEKVILLFFFIIYFLLIFRRNSAAAQQIIVTRASSVLATL
jgi:hypothetical protein